MARHKTLILFLAALLVAGCGDDIDRGIVTGKDHTAAWTQLMPQTMCTGNPPMCTTNFIPIFWPETWSLRLKDGTKTGSREVSQAAYDKCQMAEVWPECERGAS